MENKDISENLKNLSINSTEKTAAELKAERARLHKIRLEKQGIIDSKQAPDAAKNAPKKPTLSKQERRAIQDAQREAKAKIKQQESAKKAGLPVTSTQNPHDDKGKIDRFGFGVNKDISALMGKAKTIAIPGSLYPIGTPDIGTSFNGAASLPNQPAFGANLRENEELLESLMINSKKIRMFEHLEVPNSRVFSGHSSDKWKPSSLMSLGYDNSVTDSSASKPTSTSGISSSAPGTSASSTLNKKKKDLFQIHPAIKTLGLRMASSMLEGSNEKTKAMLEAFSLIIHEYKTPPQSSLARHLQVYLNPQIKFLVQQRPLSVGMGNAIRWLKEKISLVDLDQDEASTKKDLITQIRNYINERISAAVESIAVNGSTKISDGDVVLTYGHSSAVFKLLTHAFSVKKTKFSVIVIDSRVGFLGQKMVRQLVAAGMARNPEDLSFFSSKKNSSTNGSFDSSHNDCGVSYALITSLGYVMKQANKVILGAEAMLGNGSILSRSGTAMVALAARNYHVPLLVACETYKFTERVQLDSVVNNELGDPEALVHLPNEQNTNWVQLNEIDRNSISSEKGASLLISNTFGALNYNPISSDKFSAWPSLNNRRTLADPSKSSSNPSGAFSGGNSGPSTNSGFGAGNVNANSTLESLTPNLQILSKNRAINNMVTVSASLSVSSKNSNNSIYNKSAVLDPVEKEIANVKWQLLEEKNPLVNWRDIPNLKILDTTRDITPSEFVSVVVTEVGLIPTTSISVLLREYKI
ncbi:putative translation initiation factor eIF-2B subunit delta [Smittium culicis]|uniref:Translation initiation factor eIF2B subunit delta n=1 Tax=Smittium culicis TaxID=133412 RepID=A0A1R1XLU0_9FUNG|nr:putative translation initiation factor eIF-2B subunit delta [Smittium culicis]